MCIVERRKSARISALQAQKAPQEKNQILNKGKRICDAAMETGVAELDSYLNQERKKVKIRPVQDLFANSVEYQVPKRVWAVAPLRFFLRILEESNWRNRLPFTKGCTNYFRK